MLRCVICVAFRLSIHLVYHPSTQDFVLPRQTHLSLAPEPNQMDPSSLNARSVPKRLPCVSRAAGLSRTLYIVLLLGLVSCFHALINKAGSSRGSMHLFIKQGLSSPWGFRAQYKAYGSLFSGSSQGFAVCACLSWRMRGFAWCIAGCAALRSLVSLHGFGSLLLTLASKPRRLRVITGSIPLCPFYVLLVLLGSCPHCAMDRSSI